jgi:serine/threonine protein kinase
MDTTVVEPQGPTPRFGRLESVRLLGRGVMGEAFEARDPTTKERFVVKRLKNIKGLVDLMRFAREADVMRKLHHPNIMPVVHVDLTAELPFFVMPFKEGRTLSQVRVTEGKLPLAVVCHVARDVCFALAEVHRVGIIHRDVKPANLFLEASGNTLLLDFGLAKVVQSTDGLTAVGTILGTPAYMPPEQCRGETVDSRCDVYALGSTIYELLTGENPFATRDSIESIRRQLEVMPRRLDAVLPHKIPEELGELVHRMLAKSAAHRPTAERCLETFAGLFRHLERERGASSRIQRAPPT